MAWVYVEREQFVRMCDKVGLSSTVREAIKLWAPTVSRFELSRQRLVYRSPKNRYEAWAAGIPNPDSNKGKSGGYRVVYFLDLTESSINLDFIAERRELGFRDEGRRKKDRYNDYTRELKEYLKKLDA
jgi:mRNA-degrading endonuclease RelE of RelBE toxin-antitoxin system